MSEPFPISAPLVFIQAGALQALAIKERGRGDRAWARCRSGICERDQVKATRTRSSGQVKDGTKREGDLHVDVLGGQFKVIQVVVSGSVSIRVQAGGEVTAGHGHTYHSVANT